jgi:hypothetical protein
VVRWRPVIPIESIVCGRLDGVVARDVRPAVVLSIEERTRSPHALDVRVLLHRLPGLSEVVARLGEAFPRLTYSLQ